MIWPLSWMVRRWLFPARLQTRAGAVNAQALSGERRAFESPVAGDIPALKSVPLHGLTTAKVNQSALGASRHASPSRLRSCTGPSALAPPALSTAALNAALNTTRPHRATTVRSD